MELKNDYEEKVEMRGRPTKGFLKMDVDRKVRIDSETNYLLMEKCRRLGVTVADGIREGIKLFIRQPYD